MAVGRTKNEKNRDKYYDLYENLRDKYTNVKTEIDEASGHLSSFKASHPEFYYVPGDYYEDARARLTARLDKELSYARQEHKDLGTARDKAYDRYKYYKKKAAAEADNE